MLIIINEKLFNEYQKVKSKIKPKDFAKANIKYNGVRYNNSSKWIQDYFSNVDLVNLLRNYKKLIKHDKNQKMLFDLLEIE